MRQTAFMIPRTLMTCWQRSQPSFGRTRQPDSSRSIRSEGKTNNQDKLPRFKRVKDIESIRLTFFVCFLLLSSKRSLQPLLTKWGMKARLIELDSFGFDEERAEAYGTLVKDLQKKLSSLFMFEISKGFRFFLLHTYSVLSAFLLLHSLTTPLHSHLFFFSWFVSSSLLSLT